MLVCNSTEFCQDSPLKDRSGRSQSLDIDERKKNVGKKSTGGITKAFKMLQGIPILFLLYYYFHF